MKQIRKLWRKLTNAVNNRGMQFLISLSFTFVALGFRRCSDPGYPAASGTGGNEFKYLPAEYDAYF